MTDDLEPEIQALARRLLKADEEREPIVLSPRWWQERLLDFATGDPAFRVKLLRFVDVLPALRSASAVADHIRQYFRDDAPAIVEAGAILAQPAPFRPVVSRIVRESVYAMAHRFIAGETPDAAVDRLIDLRRHNIAYTVDLLGEATLSEAEADTYFHRYTELIETLTTRAPGPTTGPWQATPANTSPPLRKRGGGRGEGSPPPVNISVKLSALYSQFEPAAPSAVSAKVRERLLPLLRLAKERDAFVNVDMEQFTYKELTHAIFRDALMEPDLRDFADVGIVVQAYLKDAEDTIRSLKALAQERATPFSVRLVKGAYWEEEGIIADQNDWPVPVYEDKAETDACFERCTDLLFAASPYLRPAFGTHNPRSIAQAMVKAKSMGLQTDIEFQMLFGMADGLRDAVVEEGFRTRVYVPVGAIIPGMAYLVRRLLENTSNQSWFVRGERDATPEELLAKPTPPPNPLLVDEEGEQEGSRSSAALTSPEASRNRSVSPSPSTGRGPGGGVPPFTNLAPAPFHAAATRGAMAAALESVRLGFGTTQPLLIGDARISDRELDEVRYPADSAVLLGRVARGTADDVETAVRHAADAFPAWRDLGAAARGDILRRAAGILEDRRFELAALMVYESAKPWRETDGDVTEAVDYLRYYAREAERLAKPVPMHSPRGETNVMLREPRGVAAIIAPWNFPIAIICGMTAGALSTGNCAILKPAEQSPLIAARLVEVLRDAGVPSGAVQYLPGAGSEVGRVLVEHPQVETIAFTGSKEVGLGIIESASHLRPGQRNVKRVIAEMGGKNAIIIDDDADLDQAVAGVVGSAFSYAGQKCSACSRLIVVGSTYDEVVQRLAAAVASLVVGPPHEAASFVPPVISEEAQKRIEGYIANGKQTARLLVQGARPPGDGYYVAPTVFVDVDRSDPLARDEIFGPVLSVFHVDTMTEALDLALESEFALTGGLYSRNPRNIELVQREFRTGNLYINRRITGAVVGRHPFGGLALSGVGEKAGGPDYLLQFLRPRAVSENTARRGFAPEQGGGI